MSQGNVFPDLLSSVIEAKGDNNQCCEESRIVTLQMDTCLGSKENLAMRVIK